MGAVIGGVMSGFLAGLVLGAGLVFYYFRFRKHGFVHGAPHYLSAKSNNLYVSLPMLDLKNKHYPSSTGGGGDFDTLRSTSTVRSRSGHYLIFFSVRSLGGKIIDLSTFYLMKKHF